MKRQKRQKDDSAPVRDANQTEKTAIDAAVWDSQWQKGHPLREKGLTKYALFALIAVLCVAFIWWRFFSAGEGGVDAPANSANLFRDMVNLKSIDFGNAFSTKHTKNMSMMFTNCKSLEELDVRFFETDQVTNMASVFHNCAELKQLDLEKWETANVTSMSGMFHGCAKLEALKLGDFETAQVTNMAFMFHGCAALRHSLFFVHKSFTVAPIDILRKGW